MDQEKSILNDGVDCFTANLRKVRTTTEKRETAAAVDPLVSCLAAFFLGMFVFVFLFLLITFWNVSNVVVVNSSDAG